MINKKGFFGFIIFLIIILVLGFLAYTLYGMVKQTGNSTDYIYTIEHGDFSGWNKIWLKDDHTTMYCYDNDNLTSILTQAQIDNKKVKVYYAEYIGRGWLCSTGSDNIKQVIITKIEVLS
ncbi:hypothetical protein M0R04_09090 [Candidatus Dojkabacteria bacterium]|jgi:hypothetical protein|nr:hypothetical protein [Candidatus Dojkabacteria bacterium]